MDSCKISKLAIERAERLLKSAEMAFKEGRYDDALLFSQMCVEISTKAVLTFLGIDYPKIHDVSDALGTLKERKDLPQWFRGRVEILSQNVRRLAQKRVKACYSYEFGLTEKEFKEQAEKALNQSKFVYENCKRLILKIR